MATANSPRPTPNLDIYDFEGAIEDALEQAAKKIGIGFSVSLPQDDKAKVTPRFEAKLALGTSVLHVNNIGGTTDPETGANWQYQDRWDGTLDLTIITNRKKERGDKMNHRYARAQVRWMIQDYVKQICPFLKFINIFQLQEQAMGAAFAQSNEEDSSKISCLIKLNIRPQALPQPS